MSDVMITKLALEWLAAERAARANQQPGEVYVEPRAGDDEMPIAIDRVYQVLAGEIRWSSATAGDRHIWRGRFRDVEKFDRWWRTANLGPDPDPPTIQPTTRDEIEDRYNQTTPKPPRRLAQHPGPPIKQTKSSRRRWYVNAYDTAVVSASPFDAPGRSFAVLNRNSPVTVLFGGANCGLFRLCNLNRGYDLGFGDVAFYVDTMYATATSLRGLVDIADCVVAQFGVGDMPVTQNLPLRELVMGIPIRRVVPTRGKFFVKLELLVPKDVPIATFEVSVHLEGVAVSDD
jgi:hypothetical protein